MGEHLYYLIRTNQMQGITNDELIKMCTAELLRIDKELFLSKESLNPKRGDGVCPGCGNAAGAEVKFCVNCGTNIDEYFSTKIKACDVCDNIIDVSSVYCPACGISQKGA
jgi:RNA polymerase subunit RPABC4/transcription elongation factor Spt4